MNMYQNTEYFREKASSNDSTNYSSSHIGNSAKSDYQQNIGANISQKQFVENKENLN